jgi:hypothetical protein
VVVTVGTDGSRLPGTNLTDAECAASCLENGPGPPGAVKRP